MTLVDVAGLAGVVVILIAYAGAAMGWLDPKRPISLACNFLGAAAILWTLLTKDFNLSAAVMEGSWARWDLRRVPLCAGADSVRLGHGASRKQWPSATR